MAKLLTTLCLLSCLMGISVAAKFVIQGRVYCDTCRAGFETTATEYMPGAKVKLECKNYTTGAVTQNVEGETDKASGSYSIEIIDNHTDHDDEICEVVLIESSRDDCKEIKKGRDRARVVLAIDSGITSNVRYANSLGFLKEHPDAECGKLLQMYALSDDLE